MHWHSGIPLSSTARSSRKIRRRVTLALHRLEQFRFRLRHPLRTQISAESRWRA
jgi:hypothetical protein